MAQSVWNSQCGTVSVEQSVWNSQCGTAYIPSWSRVHVAGESLLEEFVHTAVKSPQTPDLSSPSD